ncbi:MAG: hypothetical protein ABJB74_10870 [Gemmatimonas sp.]
MKSRHFRRAVLFTALTAGAARSEAVAQTSRIRDSVGIRIVENSSRMNAPVAFTLGAKPNTDVGGLDADPEKELSSRAGYPRAIRLNDGRLAVLDVTRIQFFDQSGKRLGVTGRSGGGPGEFTDPVALCRTRGDTVLVSDGQTRRLAVLGKSGEFVSQTTFPGHGSAENTFCLEDGTFITTESLPKTAAGESVRRVNHMGRDGAVLNQVTDINTGIFDMLVIRETSTVAWGNSVFVGDGQRHEVRVFSALGKLQSVIRTDDKLESVSRSELEKMPVKFYRAGMTEAERRADAQRVAAQSKAKTWPTFGRLLVDLSGRLWMQDWTAGGKLEPDNWTAFDATGKLIGRLVIPAPESKEKSMLVVSFGRDEVIVKRSDDDGALHYTAYPIIPKK